LHKRPIILSILLTVATPYLNVSTFCIPNVPTFSIPNIETFIKTFTTLGILKVGTFGRDFHQDIHNRDIHQDFHNSICAMRTNVESLTRETFTKTFTAVFAP